MLGFGASSPRHFAPLLEWYGARGFVPDLYIASVAAGMTVWPVLVSNARALAARLARAPGRHVLHAFSNNGFITLSLVLEALASRDRSTDVAALVLDSCPGFPPEDTARAMAHFFARGLGPLAAARLGLEAHRGQRLASPIRSALTVYFRARPELRRHIAGAPARFVASRPKVPVLALHGGRDSVVPPDEVIAFADQERARGVDVTRVCWPEQDHVMAFFREREAYLEALSTHLRRAGALQ